MKEVPLSRGMVALVDDEDFIRVMQHKWYAAKRGSRHHTIFYGARLTKDREFVYLHRFILEAKAGQLVDHASGNGLDDQRENLRFASRQENVRNRHYTAAKSGARGVVFEPICSEGYPRNKPWRAYIDAGPKRTYLGWFETREEAVLTRRRAAAVAFKQFAGTA